MHIIYLITNMQTGKVYVGRTKNYKQRLAVHHCELRLGKHSNADFQRDYQIHPGNWHYQIIETFDTREDAKKAEHEWINAFPDVYNQVGRDDAVEHKAKLSAARLGKPRPPETCKRIAQGHMKPCTVDGIHIYPSTKALRAALGGGYAGYRNPNLRYI